MFHRQMKATRPRHTFQVVNPYRIRMAHHSSLAGCAVYQTCSGGRVVMSSIDQMK
jgi:hypothetical protein